MAQVFCYRSATGNPEVLAPPDDPITGAGIGSGGVSRQPLDQGPANVRDNQQAGNGDLAQELRRYLGGLVIEHTVNSPTQIIARIQRITIESDGEISIVATGCRASSPSSKATTESFQVMRRPAGWQTKPEQGGVRIEAEGFGAIVLAIRREADRARSLGSPENERLAKLQSGWFAGQCRAVAAEMFSEFVSRFMPPARENKALVIPDLHLRTEILRATAFHHELRNFVTRLGPDGLGVVLTAVAIALVDHFNSNWRRQGIRSTTMQGSVIEDPQEQHKRGAASVQEVSFKFRAIDQNQNAGPSDGSDQEETLPTDLKAYVQAALESGAAVWSV